MDVKGVPARLLTDAVWELVETYIDQAIEVGGRLESTDDVRQWVIERTIQLWIVIEDEKIISAITTEIIEYPNATVCRLRHMGGRLNKVVITKVSELVFPWAVAQGCSKVELWGRPGWEKIGNKVLKNVRRTTVVMHGDLE